MKGLIFGFRFRVRIRVRVSVIREQTGWEKESRGEGQCNNIKNIKMTKHIVHIPRLPRELADSRTCM